MPGIQWVLLNENQSPNSLKNRSYLFSLATLEIISLPLNYHNIHLKFFNILTFF